MANNTQTIADNLPALASGLGHIQPPMLAAVALVALSVGFVADSPYLLASGSNLLAEMGMTDIEQVGVRGILVGALCYVFKLLLSYHRDSLKWRDDRITQLEKELAEAQRVFREEQADRIKQLEK